MTVKASTFSFFRVEKLLLPDKSSLEHRRNICLISTYREAFEYMHPLLSSGTCLAQNQTNFLPEYDYLAIYHDSGSSNSRFLQNVFDDISECKVSRFISFFRNRVD